MDPIYILCTNTILFLILLLFRLIRQHTDNIITELMHSVTNGQLGKVNQILSYDFVDEVPAAVAMQLTQLLKQELPTTPVLHQCVTNLTRSMSTTTSSNSTSTANTTTTTTGSNNKASSSGVATSTSDTNTSTALNTAMLTALAARRLEVAKYLLNFSRPAFELGTNNKAGLSVLHHAIINGDLKLAQLIIRTFTQQQQQQTNTTTGIVEERRTKLNINSRCHKQGWAPIHYAVDKLDLDAVRLLIQNNANIVVTMATDKRQTPMELAKQKLKTANPANKSTIQAIIDELKLAIDRAKQNKEHLKNKNESATPTTTTTTNNNDSIQSSTNKTSSTITATSTSTSSSSTTKDAKTPNEKKADNVAVAATATVSTVPVEAADTAATTSKADKKKKKKDKTTTTTAAAVATTVAANASTKVAASAPVPTPTTTTSVPPPTTSTTTPIVPATTKLNRKNAKKLALAQTQSTAPPEPKQTIDPIAEMSVSSRDELVDRLLAMGFLEADCLQAISLYGTDTDQAISWLCERPAVVTPTTTTTGTGNPTTTPMKSSKDHKISAHSTDKKIHSTTTTTPSTKQSSSSTTSSSTAVTSSQQNAISSAQKLQREKEELRRINRAWNQKAEDEKRKVRLNYIVLFTITSCCCILVYT